MSQKLIPTTPPAFLDGNGRLMLYHHTTISIGLASGKFGGQSSMMMLLSQQLAHTTCSVNRCSVMLEYEVISIEYVGMVQHVLGRLSDY